MDTPYYVPIIVNGHNVCIYIYTSVFEKNSRLKFVPIYYLYNSSIQNCDICQSQ